MIAFVIQGITYSGGTNPVTCTINGVSGGSVSSGSVTFNNLLGNTVYTGIIVTGKQIGRAHV